MKPVEEFTDHRFAWMWETKTGFGNGTLLVGHIDVPLNETVSSHSFRREPEWLYGEGIGISRAPLVVMEFALRSLRYQRQLHKRALGVLYYLDEGRDCRYSAEIISRASSRAKQVLVFRPGMSDNKILIQRRGERKYRLVVEGKPKRLGYDKKITEVLLWVCEKMQEISTLSSQRDRIAVSPFDIKADTFPMLVPHRVTVELMLSYLETERADAIEDKMRSLLSRRGLRCRLEKVSDRPPMKKRKNSQELAGLLMGVSEKWEIPCGIDTSIWPSAGGLVPSRVPVVCGIGPVARDLYTPQEAVNRISLIQRTLLLAQFLAEEGDKKL